MSDSTFDRLLQTAVEVFAEKGFKEATVREICTRANVNIASVNYYFRSKQALYSSALRFAFEEANRLHPQTEASNVSLSAETRLGFFVHNFLHKLLDDSQLGFHGKLIAREISDPTEAFQQIIDEAIEPHCRLLEGIILELVPALQTNRKALARFMFSVLGQCLVFKHSRSVVNSLCPELIADQVAIEECAKHITQFSLMALTVFNNEPFDN